MTYNVFSGTLNPTHFTSPLAYIKTTCPNFTKLSVHVRPKAKFYYDILVADRSEAGRRPAASWILAYHALSSSLAGLRPASDLSATRIE